MNVAGLPVLLLNGTPSLPLSCQLAARCTGLDVELRVTQTVRNDVNEPGELTVHVPVAATAAVRRVEATLGGETIVATLEDKAQARAAYDMAVAANRRAALAEDRGGDVIVLSFGNVAAGEEASCTVVIDDSLAIESSGSRTVAVLRLPTSIPDRYEDINGPTNASLSFTAWFTGLPRASRTSLRPGPVEQDCALSASVPAGADVFFEFELDPGRTVPAFALLTPDAVSTRPALPGDSNFAYDATLALSVATARESTSEPMELVVILDRSGSMGGWKQTLANDLAAGLVERLIESDDVAVFTFDTSIEQLSVSARREESLLAAGTGALEGLAAAAYLYRNEVARKLRATAARDGTELAAAFERVAGCLRPPRKRRVTVLLTDGEVGDDAGALAAASMLGALYVVAIGEGAHHGLLANLGHCQVVSSPAELVVAADQLQAALRAPVVSAVRLLATETGASLKMELAPVVSNPLVAGSCATVYARCPSSTTSVRVVLDRPDGTSVSEHIDVRRCEPGDTFRGRYARLAIRTMERDLVLGRADRAQLVRLSLAASVLCSQTSFIAVGRELARDEIAVPASRTPMRRRMTPGNIGGFVEQHCFTLRARNVSPPLQPLALSRLRVLLALMSTLVQEVFAVLFVDPFVDTNAVPLATIDELERLGAAVRDEAGDLAQAVHQLVVSLRSNEPRLSVLLVLVEVRDALAAVGFPATAPSPSSRSAQA